MTRAEKRIVKAAIDADKLLVDVRINLRSLAGLCCDAGDREAEVLVYAVLTTLQTVSVYAVKKQRVEVDETK